MVELEIDGKKIQAEDGASIIEAADAEGIYIPRYCYHKKLSIAANCRMCLVEVEKSGKPLPACATPVTSEMKVFTRSEKALNAQRAVMEYLLINHPLDCPICDQGGECDLQDLAMGYGLPYSYYEESKRSVYNDDLGPLIDTEMTRCIHCTRCVRFGEEIAGHRELGVTYRGEKEFISTYIKHFMQSELSGNIIDLCPVGALTHKPSCYAVRGWEVTEHPLVSPHDCVGSNIFIHTRYQEYAPQRVVLRAVPRENEAINETWISNRDRFSYEGLYHSDRIYKPRMRKGERWHDVEWQEVLEAIANHLPTIIRAHGADQMAAFASPNSTVEEFYLLQQLVRTLGSPHIDHRIRQLDFSDQELVPQFPNLGVAIADIENLSAILLVGSDVRTEQPLISHRINKAVQENNAEVLVINPIDYSNIFAVKEKMITYNMIQSLAEILKVLTIENNESITELSDIVVSDSAKIMAETLKSVEKAAIFIGPHALHHPEAAQITALIRMISHFSKSHIGALTTGANSSGAWLAGCVPHRGPAGSPVDRIGSDAKSLLTSQPKRVYLLLNIEPEFDSAYSAAAIKTLKQAEFVISLSTFVTPMMERYADIILPIAPFTETDGTFVNIEGTWQSFSATSTPMGEAKPGWKILRVLGNFLQLANFNYKTIQEVRDELKQQVDAMSAYQPQPLSLKKPIRVHPENTLIRFAPWHMYREDVLVRRAKALQACIESNEGTIRINRKTADRLQLQEGEIIKAVQGENQIVLPLSFDHRVADNIVLLPSGLEETAEFGETMATIILTREA